MWEIGWATHSAREVAAVAVALMTLELVALVVEATVVGLTQTMPGGKMEAVVAAQERTGEMVETVEEAVHKGLLLLDIKVCQVVKD
jgi:hypothetical protein